MVTIHKYSVPFGRSSMVPMPHGAALLHVGMQGEGLFLWALVDTGNGVCDRVITVRGTGSECADAYSESHVGTVFAGVLVLHVFDGGESYERHDESEEGAS